jgi:hypothetical protein
MAFGTTNMSGRGEALMPPRSFANRTVCIFMPITLAIVCKALIVRLAARRRTVWIILEVLGMLNGRG